MPFKDLYSGRRDTHDIRPGGTSDWRGAYWLGEDRSLALQRTEGMRRRVHAVAGFKQALGEPVLESRAEALDHMAQVRLNHALFLLQVYLSCLTACVQSPKGML